MKKQITLFIVLLAGIINASGQCTSNYSYSGSNDTLTFTNLSSVSNAHYYWEFGDGSTSYSANPIHIFPESGEYLVTLFGLDTISNCHTYSESWITVNKPTLDPCQAFIGDSIFNFQGSFYMNVIDSSTNCIGYSKNVDCGPVTNMPITVPMLLSGWEYSSFVLRCQYELAGVLKREYYKTFQYQFSSSVNYDTCSANFEYYINYLPNGAMIDFRAMNQNAISYTYSLAGFGNPIYINSANGSYLYPYISYEKYFIWLVGLNIQDANGCNSHVWKNIMILNPNYGTTGTNELNSHDFSFYPNPANDYFTLQLNKNISNAEIRIFNLMGKLKSYYILQNLESNIDILNLSSGIYILEITAGENIIRQKFIKQ